MAACLRKIVGLSQVKLIDAVWIWTEPHSMRLKIKITVQKEVLNGAVLQQSLVVTYVIRNQQCEHCQQQFATGAWHAVVQVRQRVPHKRTFLYLEQLLLKSRAHAECINIVTFRDGMDFYFALKQQGLRFVDFLECHVPCKSKYSRKLVSANLQDGTANYKHNHNVEIVPVCKDDLLLLPRPVAKRLSDMNPLCLVKSIQASIHVIDPHSGERQELDAEKYWHKPFSAKMTSRNLTKYVVLSMEPYFAPERASAKQRKRPRKMRLAEVVVAREKDLGSNDTQFMTRTHLGNILRVGDEVYGYDVAQASWALSGDADGIVKGDLPDVVLVRKCYANVKDRTWELKQLDVEEDEDERMGTKDRDDMDRDYEMFMEELHGDKEMRRQVNLYKKAPSQKSKKGDDMSEDGSDHDDDDDRSKDEEEVRLEELLEDMLIEEHTLTALTSEEATTFQVFNLDGDDAIITAPVTAQIDTNEEDPDI